ncbi:hypothetical protein KEJ15_00815 [Candidatus Bathyarchaeota archaeon]|nr:hypothetical protein [Candidatus Bathyarchaeota archaeon]
MAILFTVSPDSFRVGTTVLLNATVIDPARNVRLVSPAVLVEFQKVDRGGGASAISSAYTENGVATCEYTYTSSEPLALIARIVPEGVDIPQSVASSPVQLTVGKPTKLLLNATWNGGAKHTFRGWLKHDSTGLAGETVTVKVNETTYTVTTGAGGYFRMTIDLAAVEGKKTIYMVTAIFNGSAPKTTVA